MTSPCFNSPCLTMLTAKKFFTAGYWSLICFTFSAHPAGLIPEYASDRPHSVFTALHSSSLSSWGQEIASQFNLDLIQNREISILHNLIRGRDSSWGTLPLVISNISCDTDIKFLRNSILFPLDPKLQLSSGLNLSNLLTSVINSLVVVESSAISASAALGLTIWAWVRYRW